MHAVACGLDSALGDFLLLFMDAEATFAIYFLSFSPDITMLPWQLTGLCAVPTASIIKRIPQRKGAELVTICHEQTVP